jgi:hypothetical protein
MGMRIAYFTTDEVHREQAARMAGACGATVQSFSPYRPPPDEPFDAVLYDLDSLAPPRRGAIIAELLASAPARRVPVGVHSYNLEDQVSALRGRGILLARRLGPDALRGLAVRRADEPDRRGTGPGDRPEAVARPSLAVQIMVSAEGVVLADGR